VSSCVLIWDTPDGSRDADALLRQHVEGVSASPTRVDVIEMPPGPLDLPAGHWDEGKAVADGPTSPVPTGIFSAAPTSSCVTAPPAATFAPTRPPATGTPEGTEPRVGVVRGRSTQRRSRASRTFEVHVRSMNDPRPGWTADRALGQLAQGYSVEHVSRLSGYAVPFLRSRLRPS